jgi:hypothetical protein
MMLDTNDTLLIASPGWRTPQRSAAQPAIALPNARRNYSKRPSKPDRVAIEADNQKQADF